MTRNSGAAVSYGIGHGFGENWTTATKALAHGVSQGIISELRGGEFKSGFIGGFLDEKRYNKHQLLDVYRFGTETVGTKCSRVGSRVD